VAVPPAPVRIPSQKSLAPSVASVTSVANDKSDNEMILGAVHRSPGICLTAVEKPRKPQLGDHVMKGLCDQSSPQMRSVGLHRTSGREKEGKQERMGKTIKIFVYLLLLVRCKCEMFHFKF
jgi:hypothetical protein